MCRDPWEESIQNFAQLYLDAVKESEDKNRTGSHRQVWAGRAEGFEREYPEKLKELDEEELSWWIEDIEADYKGEDKERLLVPAEKEKANRG